MGPVEVSLSYLGIAIIIGFVFLMIALFLIVFYLIKKDSNKKEKPIRKELSSSDIDYVLGDVILQQGKTYTVKKDGAVIPGKYMAISGSENVKKFSMRCQGFVREYTNGDEIVLDEAEEITPVSSNVILK